MVFRLFGCKSIEMYGTICVLGSDVIFVQGSKKIQKKYKPALKTLSLLTVGKFSLRCIVEVTCAVWFIVRK